MHLSYCVDGSKGKEGWYHLSGIVLADFYFWWGGAGARVCVCACVWGGGGRFLVGWRGGGGGGEGTDVGGSRIFCRCTYYVLNADGCPITLDYIIKIKMHASCEIEDFVSKLIFASCV